MVPWVLVYGVNILGLFAGSIVAFYQMEGSLKSLGVVPLFWGTFILMGHILVMVRGIIGSSFILSTEQACKLKGCIGYASLPVYVHHMLSNSRKSKQTALAMVGEKQELKHTQLTLTIFKCATEHSLQTLCVSQIRLSHDVDWSTSV